MKSLLNQPIKAVINQYPVIGDLLEAYGVACTTCSVGTCLLKDIVSIHSLTKEQETGLFVQMAEVVAGKNPDFTKVVQPQKLEFIQPLQRMIDEHKIIKKVLKMIPDVCELILREPTINVARIENIVQFIREYADTYHHAKEEGILFTYVDQSQDIIQIMLHDHDAGRGFVRGMLAAAQANDVPGLINNLIQYRDLLKGHIQKEDEILYPWFQRQLSAEQQHDLIARCTAVDANYVGVDAKYLEFILSLERETTGVLI